MWLTQKQDHFYTLSVKDRFSQLSRIRKVMLFLPTEDGALYLVHLMDLIYRFRINAILMNTAVLLLALIMRFQPISRSTPTKLIVYWQDPKTLKPSNMKYMRLKSNDFIIIFEKISSNFSLKLDIKNSILFNLNQFGFLAWVKPFSVIGTSKFSVSPVIGW